MSTGLTPSTDDVRRTFVYSRAGDRTHRDQEYRDQFDRWLASVKAEARAETYPMIRDMVDPDDCWFDHHGGCQAHGYLTLGIDGQEECPHAEGKRWLAAYRADESERETTNE